jgi:hypothetical protein
LSARPLRWRRRSLPRCSRRPPQPLRPPRPLLGRSRQARGKRDIVRRRRRRQRRKSEIAQQRGIRSGRAVALEGQHRHAAGERLRRHARRRPQPRRQRHVDLAIELVRLRCGNDVDARGEIAEALDQAGDVGAVVEIIAAQQQHRLRCRREHAAPQLRRRRIDLGQLHIGAEAAGPIGDPRAPARPVAQQRVGAARRLPEGELRRPGARAARHDGGVVNLVLEAARIDEPGGAHRRTDTRQRAQRIRRGEAADIDHHVEIVAGEHLGERRGIDTDDVPPFVEAAAQRRVVIPALRTEPVADDADAVAPMRLRHRGNRRGVATIGKLRYEISHHQRLSGTTPMACLGRPGEPADPILDPAIALARLCAQPRRVGDAGGGDRGILRRSGAGALVAARRSFGRADGGEALRHEAHDVRCGFVAADQRRQGLGRERRLAALPQQVGIELPALHIGLRHLHVLARLVERLDALAACEQQPRLRQQRLLPDRQEGPAERGKARRYPVVHARLGTERGRELAVIEAIQEFAGLRIKRGEDFRHGAVAGLAVETGLRQAQRLRDVTQVPGGKRAREVQPQIVRIPIAGRGQRGQRGLDIADAEMARGVVDKLRDRHAGVEGCITPVHDSAPPILDGLSQLRRRRRRGVRCLRRCRALALEQALTDLAVDVHQHVDLRGIGLTENLRGVAVDEIAEPEEVGANFLRQRAFGVDEVRLEDRPQPPIAPDRVEQFGLVAVLCALHQSCGFKQRPGLRLSRIARLGQPLVSLCR